MTLHHRIEQLWWQKKEPPLWLQLAEPTYRYLNRKNLEKRAARCTPPPLPMISIGNITVGGSGKTPFTVWLAQSLKQQGWQPVILCRGDGGNSKLPLQIHTNSNPKEAGDEALLLHQQSDCPVIAARDRVTAANMAKELGNILLLDDGFQYRQLQRACDIVLVPAAGTGNGHQLPAGPLREPLQALHRADLIVRTGEGSAKPLGTTTHEWHWTTQPTSPVDITTGNTRLPTHALLVSAIARPERLIDSLNTLNIQTEQHRFFPDHHNFTEQEVHALSSSALPVIVTAKDAVKLMDIWPGHIPLWVLGQQPEAETGLFEAILSFLPDMD